MPKYPKSNVPEFIKCMNDKCGRKVIYDSFYRQYPDSNIPAERIHYINDRVMYSILCTCGHFTISKPNLSDETN
jgi:hypothetical protein